MTGKRISFPLEATQYWLRGVRLRSGAVSPTAKPYLLATDTEISMLAVAVGPVSCGAFPATGLAAIEIKQATANRRWLLRKMK